MDVDPKMVTVGVLGGILALLAYCLIFYTWPLLTIAGFITLGFTTNNIINIIKIVINKDEVVSSKNKAVLVTGCDSGFGNLLARRLDQLGYVVFAGCLFSAKDGAVQLKEQTTDRLHIVQLDVTSVKDVKKAVDSVKETLQSTNTELWAVVNNAGIGWFMRLEWTSIKTLEQLLAVNSIGPVRIIKAFLPFLRHSKGRIVNVASAAGRGVTYNFIPYCMTKHAMVALSDGLRLELKDFGISVASIEPSLYRTNICELDQLIDRIRKEWDKVEDSVKAVYGEDYMEAQLGMIRQMVLTTGSDNLGEVIDAMEHAITAVTPRLVYAPPEPKSNIMRLVTKIMPLAMYDKLREKFEPMLKPAYVRKRK